ncbi:hypothetical protein TKK_0005599 [Trichogramma kaykai]|uniref:Uncharacterized protein n=1 Tax=Trichogramma kaykai TaxID=54128 RepID=A0ABD2XI46_9HYME
MDNGAELSSFVFPTESHFGERYESRGPEWCLEMKLKVASGAMAVSERLEKRGYELTRNDALTIMKFFKKLKLFQKSMELKHCWQDYKSFAREAKKIQVNSSLSLYKLVYKEAAKLLKYTDYYSFSRSAKFFNKLTGRDIEACAGHLISIVSRLFVRRWALDPILELTRNRLPILCCDIVIEQLSNEDICNICLAATSQNHNNCKKNPKKNVTNCTNKIPVRTKKAPERLQYVW